MIALTVFLSFSALRFSAAQAGDSPLQIKAIEAHFNQSGIVPSLLATFEPTALLGVNFAGIGDITPGQPLTKEQAAIEPTVNVTSATSTVELNGKYTIAMVDADTVGSNLSKGENRHWLLNGVTITESKVSNVSATPITAYAGPGPAAGSGPHRYVIILYSQPDNFTAPDGLSQSTGVELFDVNAYAKNTSLILRAATYFTVEEGQATVSIPPTSPVISSTLPLSEPTSTSTVSRTSNSTNNINEALSLNGYPPLSLALGALVVMLAV